MKSMVGRVCAIAALFAVLSPAFAQDETAAAATAASASCGHVAALSHRGPAFRSLSSANTNKLEGLCTFAKVSASKVRFWYSPKYKWTLYLNQPNKKCWEPDMHLSGPVSLCMKARADVRIYGQQLAKLNLKIENLTRPRLSGWLLEAFTCIHGNEGAWNSNTGNGYYGGLQMDIDFQRNYGMEYLHRWGTADNWPIWAQLHAALRAYSSGLGFGPWPNTARYCGLSIGRVDSFAV
jgi:hypothetical protein